VTGVAETPVRVVDGLDWDAALEAIGRAGSILLACHLNPDGDALGSMLAAGQGLAQLGRPVQASFPSPFTLPEVFAELPGRELLVPADEADAAPDLLITFDAGSADRLGDLAGRLGTAGTVLVLDHHASNTRFGTLNLVDPTAAATGVLVDELLTRLGARLTPEIAECLYVAVSTDTGSFKYEATTPAVHELAARLLATGIRHDEISGGCTTPGRSGRCGCWPTRCPGPPWRRPRPAAPAWCGATPRWTTWPGTASGRRRWRA
jgi:phosphoesterase RecJ-like protein